MQAIVYTRHGSPEVLHLQDVEKPNPQENELLVKIHAAALNALDSHLMRGLPVLNSLAKPKPKIPGVDLAGRVEAIGSAVTRFKVGDEVFGNGRGACAEYVVTLENRLVLKPANVSFEMAAAVPVAALTALQGLRNRGEIKAGQKVLIHGAGGGVGTFAVQIAKSFGAEVTAVCSTKNIETVTSIGADHVIDYTTQDFTRSGIHYDLILTVNGYHTTSSFKRALSPQGILVMAGASKSHMVKALFQAVVIGGITSRIGKQKVRLVSAKINETDMLFLSGLLASGKLKPVIDSLYPLHETADAMRHLEEWHSKGKIIIQVST